MSRALSVRRTIVGSALRRYREAHGFTLEDAARVLECHASKVSRIETGQRGIRPKELRELLDEYGVDPHAQGILAAITKPGRSNWPQDYRKVIPDSYLDFLVIEGSASSIRTYAPLQVPDLLCTAWYAHAVAEADLTVPQGCEESRVEVTLAHRQAILFSRRPDVQVVIGEAALRQQVGDRLVMDRQCEHLVRLSSSHPWLDIRVLPFSVGAHAGGDSGAFSVLRFSELTELGLVHVAGASGGLCLDDAPSVASYAKTFTHLSSCALSREQSLAMFSELAEH